MDPGLLIVPFVILLATLTLKRSTLLLALWVFLYFGLPSVQNRFFGISIYWCDVTGVAVLLQQLFVIRGKGMVKLDQWWLILSATMGIGIIGSFVRYGVYLEPTYITLRSAVSLAPLVVLPRVVAMPGALSRLALGLVASGILLGAVAFAQSYSSSAAMRLESILYSGHGTTVSEEIRQARMVATGSQRVHGPYGSPTAFGGTSALAAIVLMSYTHFEKRTKTAVIAIACLIVAALLTYSRHGLLALAAFAGVIAVRRPTRLPKIAGIGLLLAAVSFLVVSPEYWAERLGRGGLSDPNIAVRVIVRPGEAMERIAQDPGILLYGSGLGLEWFLSGAAKREALFGFVSNTFYLYLFYCGVIGFFAYLAFFVSTFRRALRLGREHATFLAASVGAALVIASDNYAFTKMTVPFAWSTIAALIYLLPSRAAAAAARVDPEEPNVPRETG